MERQEETFAISISNEVATRGEKLVDCFPRPRTERWRTGVTVHIRVFYDEIRVDGDKWRIQVDFFGYVLFRVFAVEHDDDRPRSLRLGIGNGFFDLLEHRRVRRVPHDRNDPLR